MTALCTTMALVSPEEYLRLERAAETKSEYDDGVMYAMAGASEPHNMIVGNLNWSFRNRLASRCRTYPSDMKVRVLNPTRFYYPDVTITCDVPRFADDQKDVLLNPLIVFEVLSPDTADLDRGRKFHGYQTIDSLQEYVLISQDGYLVEHYRRDGAHWVYTPVEGRDAHVALPAVGCELPLEEIYRQVEIEPPPR
ncbi:MAG TPA: Uma2 family endonuclease [Thermoanaerobaculia bacterium]|nr:Uma2 family endonuclease [Thermoanaerobaculia bacterium]